MNTANVLDWIQLITGVIGIVTIVPSVIIHFINKRLDRRRATLEAYHTLENEALLPLNHYEPNIIRQIVENSNKAEYKQEYIDLRSKVALIEHFSVGIYYHIYDKKTAYELGKGFLNGTIKRRIDPIINQANRFGDHKYYIHTMKMMSELDILSNKDKEK